ncbi:Retrovirus-related Pol polyprotein from transposon opus [Gossypium australe]|uniref:Retrovirus-related Pol polyprotein from transposon opus n=1 Tax=Gossypium australe TaxID=47621 RepID=A0A5B6X1Y7_9ROSI|nr:Retrovirus-related Pol polyprotein from transposon opus [Gossypium australe]
MLMNKLPPKLKDPMSFTIPCSIGNHYFGKALCDLGEIINLMSMSVFRKLQIGKARPMTIMLQLVDQCYAHPKECEANKYVPIILGRPFLATGRTLIYVQKRLIDHEGK